jgi:glycosyltransferase involved in cell wall biosynthesis
VVRSGVQNDVRFLGFVPIEVLRIFYDSAKIFVFPSLYEGFGLPPLEAMAHGTPVVTSNATSLPEVVGNAAVLVNPENVFEIMRALHRVLMDRARLQTSDAVLMGEFGASRFGCVSTGSAVRGCRTEIARGGLKGEALWEQDGPT